MIDLRGKVALVPSGSGGIGSAIAQVLAASGADIIVGYHSNGDRAISIVEEAKRSGRRARADLVDATKRDEVKRWVDQDALEFEHIDILANCVGWRGHFQPLKDQPPDEWLQIINIELIAAIYFAHAVLDHMFLREAGRIITLSSDSAKATSPRYLKKSFTRMRSASSTSVNKTLVEVKQGSTNSIERIGDEGMNNDYPETRLPLYQSAIDWDALFRDYPVPDVFAETIYQSSPGQLRDLQNERFLAPVEDGWRNPFYRRRWEAAGLQPAGAWIIFLDAAMTW